MESGAADGQRYGAIPENSTAARALRNLRYHKVRRSRQEGLLPT
jgi:hypothetical protein